MKKFPTEGQEAAKEAKEPKEAKNNDEVEIPVGKWVTSIRNNPWMIASFILAVALIVVFIMKTGPVTSNGTIVTEKEASANLINFINAQGTEKATLVSSSKEGSLYKVTVNFRGQDIPVYVTLDGQFLITQPIPLNATTTAGQNNQTAPAQQDIPKTAKPKVELFVMSFCPYGTQMEKGILPVANLLKDKIDFSVKFVSYSMHGEKEIRENLVQYCIEKDQKPKYLDYLKCFLNSTDGSQTVSDACVAKYSIDKAKLKTCMNATDVQFQIWANFNDTSKWLNGAYPQFNTNKDDNAKYGVQGSPTLIINGVEAQTGRDSVSLLNTICGAFTTEPSECNTQLEAGTPSPGFGFDQTGSANLATCGG